MFLYPLSRYKNREGCKNKIGKNPTKEEDFPYLYISGEKLCPMALTPPCRHLLILGAELTHNLGCTPHFALTHSLEFRVQFLTVIGL